MSLIGLNKMMQRVALVAMVVVLSCSYVVAQKRNPPVELMSGKGHSDRVVSIAFSPDGKTLASGSWDQTIKLWEVNTGQLIRTLSGHSFWVTSIAFSPDGKLLASGSWDDTIKLWEVSSGQLLLTLSGHSKDIASIAFSPDGKRIASGEDGGAINLWEVSSGQQIRTISEFSKGTFEVRTIAFSPNGKLLVSGSASGITLWDIDSGSIMYSMTTDDCVRSVSFNPNGKTVALGSGVCSEQYAENPSVMLWNPLNGRPLRSVINKKAKEEDQLQLSFEAVAFSYSGKMLAAAYGDPELGDGIKIWNTASWQRLRTIRVESPDAIAFSPDEKMLVSGCSNGSIALWSTASGKLLRTFKADLRDPGKAVAASSTPAASTSTVANTETPKPTPRPKDITQPKIIITSPSLTSGQGVKPAADRILKQSGSSLTVTGQATDESGVREVTVRGVAALLDARGNFSAKVPLQVGDNPITVTATDNSGNQATVSFTVRRESEPPPVTGRYFALVIGNNRYPNLPPERQLKTAINDAQEVAKLLHTEYGFQTKLLTDGKRAEIINALSEYRRSLKADDNLLIYYAGHGHFDKEADKAYWIPVDAELTSPAYWIIADDVTSTIRAIPAHHILIVSDSCYSGTLTRATDFRLSTPSERERYLEKMRGGASRILMASGGNEPVADGGGGNHSIFARALLNGLRGMDERVFTAEELFYRYIKEQVAGKSNQAPEYRYIQASGHDSGDFVFVRVK